MSGQPDNEFADFDNAVAEGDEFSAFDSEIKKKEESQPSSGALNDGGSGATDDGLSGGLTADINEIVQTKNPREKLVEKVKNIAVQKFNESPEFYSNPINRDSFYKGLSTRFNEGEMNFIVGEDKEIPLPQGFGMPTPPSYRKSPISEKPEVTPPPDVPTVLKPAQRFLETSEGMISGGLNKVVEAGAMIEEGNTSGAILHGTVGMGEAALGLGNFASAPLAAFTVALNESPKEVHEAITPSDYEWVQNAIKKKFTDKGEPIPAWVEDAQSIANFAVGGAVFGAVHAGVKGTKASITKMKEAVKEATPEEINRFASKLEQAEHIRATEELNIIKNDINNNPDIALFLEKKVTETAERAQATGEKITNDHLESAVKGAEVEVARETIEGALKDETISPVAKETLKEQLAELPKVEEIKEETPIENKAEEVPIADVSKNPEEIPISPEPVETVNIEKNIPKEPEVVNEPRAGEVITEPTERSNEVSGEPLPPKEKVLESEVKGEVEPTKEVTKADDGFRELVHKNIESEEIKNTLSNIERETGREFTKEEKEYNAVKLRDALEHGTNVVEKAKVEFGDNYAPKLLEYLDENKKTLSTSQKSLIQIAMELDLERQIQANPENTLTLEKQLKLVRDKSLSEQRSAAQAIGYGRLRQIARVGYDVTQVTDQFFSAKEREGKRKVEKSIEATPEEINKAADAKEEASIEVETKAKETKKAKRAERIKKADALLAEGIDELAAALGWTKAAIGDKKPSPVKALQKIGDALIKKGEATAENVYEKIKEHVKAKFGKDLPDTYKTEVSAGLKQRKTVAEKNIARLEKELEDVKKGKIKYKEEREKTAREKELRDEINDAKDELGLYQPKTMPKKPASELQKHADKLQSRIDGLEKTLDDLLQGKVKESAEKVVDAPEITSLKEKIQQAKEDLGIIQGKAMPKKPLSEVEKAIARKEKIKQDILDGKTKFKTEREKSDYEKQLDEEIYQAKVEKGLIEGKSLDGEITPKERLKQLLIDEGFDRELKGGKKAIDWRKLAGEEGSIERMKENVAKSLEKEGLTKEEIAEVQLELENEYHDLRASVIEKSLNELNSRNKEPLSVDQKTSARKLAELYNYGLFEKEATTYDRLLNKALGMSEVGIEAFAEAKQLAKALSDLHLSKNKGEKVSDLGVEHGARVINHEIERLLTKIAWEQSNGVFKAATVAKEYMGLAQRNLLVSLKQLIENPMSGFIQRAFSKIGFSFDKVDNKSLRQNRSKLARAIYEDSVRNGGLIYGDVTTPFVTHSQAVNWLNRQSDSKVYHTAVSAMIGRPFLEGADSMYKVALTEKYFTYNLIKVLTDPRNPNKMSKADAVNYVSEQLTGESFETAKATAREIINNINSKADKELIPENEQSVTRLANDIIKDSLLKGEKLTAKQVEAAQKSAYDAAGFDLGHEANNPISTGVSKLTASIEHDIKVAVKEKKWNEAAALTFASILSKNILNPFVGGGTNWTVLTLQKAGLDPISPLFDYARKKSNPIDVTTEAGIKNMQNAMEKNLRSKNTGTRVLAGAAASIIAYSAFRASGADEPIHEWLKKNEWARKYFNVLSPQALVFLMYQKDKELGKYFSSLLNIKVDTFDDSKKLLRAVDNISKGKNEEGKGKLGELVGGKTSTPLIPYKLARDVQNVIRGNQDKSQIKNKYGNEGFFEGFYQQGIVNYISSLIDADKFTKESTKEKILTDEEAEQKAKEKIADAEKEKTVKDEKQILKKTDPIRFTTDSLLNVAERKTKIINNMLINANVQKLKGNKENYDRLIKARAEIIKEEQKRLKQLK